MSSELLTPTPGAKFPLRRFIILAVIVVVIVVISFVSRSSLVTSIFSAAPTSMGLLEKSFEPEKDYSSAIGYYAAPFALKANDGTYVDTRKNEGKPVMLVFQTTWCQYCRQEKDLLNTYSKDPRFSFISIDIKESDRLVSNHVKQFGIQYPWYIDETGDVSHWFLVAGTPTHIFINKEGKIVRRETGYRSKEQLDDAITAMLAS